MISSSVIKIACLVSINPNPQTADRSQAASGMSDEEEDEAAPPLPPAALPPPDREAAGRCMPEGKNPKTQQLKWNRDLEKPAVDCDNERQGLFPWYQAPNDTTTSQLTECVHVSSSDSGATLDLKLDQQQDTAAPSEPDSEASLPSKRPRVRTLSVAYSVATRARQRTMKNRISMSLRKTRASLYDKRIAREQKMNDTAINLFKKLDTNDSGGLDINQFGQLAKELGQRMTRVDLDTVRRRPHDVSCQTLPKSGWMLNPATNESERP